MKKLLLGFLILTLISISSQTSKAQSIEILAGNTLNGAINGTLLGGAAMAIADNSEFHPLRVGLGLGSLYGIGMAGFDLVYGGGSQILVSGLFNDGSNSSIIVLLDTFYGAAAGAVIATSVALVANEPIVDGLQYGSGIGAFAGFGFGVFDTFFIAKRTKSPVAYFPAQPRSASGLLAVNFDKGTSVGFVNPSVIQTLELNSSSFSAQINPTVEFVNLRVNF